MTTNNTPCFADKLAEKRRWHPLTAETICKGSLGDVLRMKRDRTKFKVDRDSWVHDLAFIIWLALCICAMPGPQNGDVIYNKINDIKSYILLLTSPVLQSETMFSDSFV